MAWRSATCILTRASHEILPGVTRASDASGTPASGTHGWGSTSPRLPGRDSDVRQTQERGV